MPVNLIVGLMGGSAADGSENLQTTAGMQSFLDICAAHGITQLDTARVYADGRSEEFAGSAGACGRFAVSTKAPAYTPGSLTYDNILANCRASLEALRTEKVDIYYLHGPDPATPLEEQCRAINHLYREGRFARFGVSNLMAGDVQRIHDICAAQGYPLPCVYTGGYNPVARGLEEELFPLLRKLGMAFHAFSPLAGGLLAKPIDEILKPRKGTRYDAMPVFGEVYLTESILAGLTEVQRLCDGEAVPLMEATLRWLHWHSQMSREDWEAEQNGVVVGASSEAQLKANLVAWEKGPLSDRLLQAWEDLHRVLTANGRVPGSKK